MPKSSKSKGRDSNKTVKKNSSSKSNSVSNSLRLLKQPKSPGLNTKAAGSRQGPIQKINELFKHNPNSSSPQASKFIAWKKTMTPAMHVTKNPLT